MSDLKRIDAEAEAAASGSAVYKDEWQWLREELEKTVAYDREHGYVPEEEEAFRKIKVA